MKRLVWMLIATAVAVCACAAVASAFTARDPFPFDEIEANSATFGGGNVLNLTAHHGASSLVTTGFFGLTGTDANGTHQLNGTVDCMQVSDPTGAVLAHVDSSVGEPANVYGVLFQLSDPEARNTNTGAGDTIAVTMLNQKQYQHALASGCTAAAGRQSLTSGNIIVEHTIPCDNQCGGGGVR